MNVRQNNISCYTFGQMPEDAKLPTIICPFHIWIFGTKGSAQSFGGAHLYWMVLWLQVFIYPCILIISSFVHRLYTDICLVFWVTDEKQFRF